MFSRIISAAIALCVLMGGFCCFAETDVGHDFPTLYWEAEADWNTAISEAPLPETDSHWAPSDSAARYLGNGWTRLYDIVNAYEFSPDSLYVNKNAVKSSHGQTQRRLPDGYWLISSDVQGGYLTYAYETGWTAGASIQVMFTDGSGAQTLFREYVLDTPAMAVLYQDEYMYFYTWEKGNKNYIMSYKGNKRHPYYAKLVRIGPNVEMDSYDYWIELGNRMNCRIPFCVDREGTVYYTKHGVEIRSCSPNGEETVLYTYDYENCDSYEGYDFLDSVCLFSERELLLCRLRQVGEDGVGKSEWTIDLVSYDLEEASLRRILEFGDFAPRMQMIYDPDSHLLVFFACNTRYIFEYYFSWDSNLFNRPEINSAGVGGVYLINEEQPELVNKPFLIYTTEEWNEGDYTRQFPYTEQMWTHRVLSLN